MFFIVEFDDNQIYCITYQASPYQKIDIVYVGEYFDVLEMFQTMVETDSFISEVLNDRYGHV